MVITTSMFKQCDHDYKFVCEMYLHGIAYEQYKCDKCGERNDVEVPT